MRTLYNVLGTRLVLMASQGQRSNQTRVFCEEDKKSIANKEHEVFVEGVGEKLVRKCGETKVEGVKERKQRCVGKEKGEHRNREEQLGDLFKGLRICELP